MEEQKGIKFKQNKTAVYRSKYWINLYGTFVWFSPRECPQKWVTHEWDPFPWLDKFHLWFLLFSSFVELVKNKFKISLQKELGPIVVYLHHCPNHSFFTVAPLYDFHQESVHGNESHRNRTLSLHWINFIFGSYCFHLSWNLWKMSLK